MQTTKVKKRSLKAPEVTNESRGTVKIAKGGYGFIDFPDISYFIPEVDLLGALDGDEVLFSREADYGKVIKIIKHAHSTLVMEVVEYYGKYEFYCLNRQINKTALVLNAGDYSLVAGQYLETEVVSYYPQLQVKIVQIIGHRNDPGIDITAILLDSQLPLQFPQSVIQQANKIESEVKTSDLIGRKDHCDLLTVTIDGADAKDLDDAISLVKQGNKYQLYVHIADVAHYVKEKSSIDSEAYRRTSSIYVVDRVVPMLPHSLSNGICSLDAGKVRLTITCYMLVNGKGEVEDYSLYPSYISSAARLTYDEVNELYAKHHKNIELSEEIRSILFLMLHCSLVIRERREKAGALDFDKKEAEFTVDKQGKVTSVKARERKAAEKMIEDFMVAANETVAKVMDYLEIPTVYRVHDQPPSKKFNDFLIFLHNMLGLYPKGKKTASAADLQAILKQCQGKNYQQAVNTMMLRSMSKAAYSPNCSGHFGLALQHYLHFTAPIRRYADLYVHRQLHKYYFPGNYNRDLWQLDNERLPEIADYLGEKERDIMAAEYEVEDMKKAEYMIKYQNQQVSGTISSITEHGFYVELANTIEGFVHVASLKGYFDFDRTRSRWINYGSGRSYKLGQSVNCLVVRADAQQRLIEFEVIEGKPTKRKGSRKRGKSHSY